MFTFKKNKPTGLRKSVEQPYIAIKIKKKKVGYISRERFAEFFKIRLMIKKEVTEKDPAPFKWIQLKQDCKDEQEAREFLNKYYELIIKKYDLYYLED